jgi:hypothetical protein
MPHHSRWERPGTHCSGGWVGPRAVLDGCGKSRHHRDSFPGPSSPYRVAISTELSRPTLLRVHPFIPVSLITPLFHAHSFIHCHISFVIYHRMSPVLNQSSIRHSTTHAHIKKIQFLPYSRSIGSWICLTHKTYTCHTVQNTIRYDIR